MHNIQYLCLQVTREGQASHAHVHEIIAGLRQGGLNVSLWEPPHEEVAEANLWSKIRAFVHIQRKMWSAGKPDCVYIRMHVAAFPSVIWALLRGVPVVQEVNGNFENMAMLYPRYRILAPLIKAVTIASLRLSSALITVTPELRDWLLGLGVTCKVHVVANGANTKRFQPGPRLNVSHDPYVVFVGAMAPWHDIETMLAAVHRPEWPRDVKLTIVGDGPEATKVRAAATADDRIQYCGRIAYGAVPALYAGALAALSPRTSRSSQHGFSPLKVYEALSCGTPVIVARFPGQTEVVEQHRCGLVIEPESAEHLAKAVGALWAEPHVAEEMGNRGRKAVVNEHSWQHRAATTRTILDAVSPAQ
jgi:glycosyltransferase involved in cell wall biosynthesis